MGKIYTFYSPQRGSGLTTLLVKIAKWLAANTELQLGQSLSEAAGEVIPRFVLEEFEILSRDLAVETESLAPLVARPVKQSPA